METPPKIWKFDHPDSGCKGKALNLKVSSGVNNTAFGVHLGIGYSLQVDADPNNCGAGERVLCEKFEMISQLPRQKMLREHSDVGLWNNISREHQALLLHPVHLLLVLQLFSRF